MTKLMVKVLQCNHDIVLEKCLKMQFWRVEESYTQRLPVNSRGQLNSILSSPPVAGSLQPRQGQFNNSERTGRGQQVTVKLKYYPLFLLLL